jgi:serine O-acetyltransferase
VISWHETLARIGADLRRLDEASGAGTRLGLVRSASLLLRPETGALALYRFGHYAHARGWGLLARMTRHLNLMLTGADIDPASEIGSGCLIVHTVGLVCLARIGANATIFAQVVIAPDDGGDLSAAPTIGNNVRIGSRASILGNLTLADGVHVAPLSLIRDSVTTPGCLVSCMPGDVRRVLRR